MRLRMFKTLWGFDGDYARAAAEASAAGFQGLEGQVPVDPAARDALAGALREYDLRLVAEITTGGSYVPDRHADVARHLADLEAGLQRCRELAPERVSVIGGCDAWPEADSLRFFERAQALAGRHGLPVSFETHRSRSLFTPWVTRRMVESLPGLELTADFSHWCVVCERLMDSELETLRAIAPRVAHVHARVGYDQGPQVPHPAAPEHAADLAAHQRWWEIVWAAQRARGRAHSSMTPEFGPDGYLHRLPFTGAPVADLWQINRWMAETERAHFARFLAGERT